MPHLRRPLLAAVAPVAVLVVSATLLSAPSALADSGSPATVLRAGGVLTQGQSMTSPAKGFLLVMQTDGNLVEYAATTSRPVWYTNTVGRGDKLVMQTDGNLVLYDARGQWLWASGTRGTGATDFTIGGNGTLAVRTSSGQAVWSANPGYTDAASTVIGSMSATRGSERFTFGVRSDGNAVVTLTDTAAGTTRDLWSTRIPTRRPTYLVWQSDGNIVLYDEQTRQALWNSGTWGAPVTLVMQGDGNLVAYRSGAPVWSTGTSTPPPGTTPPPTTPAPPTLSIGKGFTKANQPADDWLRNNPGDSRAATIAQRIASQPAGLWLTGYESMGNLRAATRQSLAADTTMNLVVYNIPGRDDGVTPPSGAGSVADYTAWITSVAQTVGSARAIVVLEPDALWFVDRQTPPGTSRYTDRMTALNNAVNAFAANSPNTRVYLDAGTSSGSVTAARMGDLLVAAGVKRAAGYAVNTSSFAPTAAISGWASAIRSRLQGSGVSDPRFVVDTGRNGNPSWDYTWCNPSGRRLGTVPALVGTSDGLDFNLWIKQPGTSDGSCGVGPGTYGGQFMPDVAMKMITG